MLTYFRYETIKILDLRGLNNNNNNNNTSICKAHNVSIRAESEAPNNNNNTRNNNNNNHDDIYNAVIMIELIARVHSVHMVNVEQRQPAADPRTKPSVLGCA